MPKFNIISFSKTLLETMGGSMYLARGVHGHPSPREKKLLYSFFNLFFICILRMMLIDGHHSYLKSLDPLLISMKHNTRSIRDHQIWATTLKDCCLLDLWAQDVLEPG